MTESDLQEYKEATTHGLIIPFSSFGGVWSLLSHPQSSFQIHLLVIYPQGTA